MSRKIWTVEELGTLLWAQSQGRHTVDCLEERGVERGRATQSSLKRRERAIVTQTNIGTVSDWAHMGFSERIDTIWTELNCRHHLHHYHHHQHYVLGFYAASCLTLLIPPPPPAPLPHASIMNSLYRWYQNWGAKPSQQSHRSGNIHPVHSASYYPDTVKSFTLLGPTQTQWNHSFC